jgi:hypothetical protein
MTNEEIAARLREYATQLDSAGGNLFRARSYRSAAFAIARLQRPLREVFEASGRAGLEAIPGIGISMGYTIEALLTSGEFRVLREPDAPQRALMTLPGVGPRLAETLRDRLGIRTLEQLREAGRDGRLTRFVGKRQLAGILLAVEARLQREKAPVPPADEPPVADLLAVDAAFRASDQPVYLEQRDGWRLRACAANTALAHRLGMTGDWVTIAFARGDAQGERTVVTEAAGVRIVRGREAECREAIVYGLKLIEPAA